MSVSVRKQCTACERPASMCYCAILPSLPHRWGVHIFQDQREATHPLGTARPAVRALQHATIQALDLARAEDYQNVVDDWLAKFGSQAALIYPGPDAQPISALAALNARSSKDATLSTEAVLLEAVAPPKMTAPAKAEVQRPPNDPGVLVFIDATWRRSRRILHTWPALADLPRYRLENVPPSRYRIRKAPHGEALSTLEAIAATLQALEPAVFDAAPLLQLMNAIIERQIGHIPPDVYSRHYVAETPPKDATSRSD